MRKPVLLYDGECGFCRLWIGRWRVLTGDAVEYAPYQSAGSRYTNISAGELSRAVHFVEPDGRVTRGALGVFRALRRARGWGWLATLHERVPPFAAAADAAYAVVAARRPLFSRLTRALWGAHLTPPPAAGAARVFLAALGLCYLAAFVSFGTQLRGLIGAQGLMPAAQLLAAAGERLGPERFWLLPTAAWLSTGDAFLIGLCVAGAAASLALVAGSYVGPAALACWALYLSLASIGSDFMNFQWEALLLETGLIAAFLAPWTRRSAAAPEPSRAALLLLRLLLAKLMLQSGVVKLVSGDPSWKDLTALTYHYWTQPLPVPLAWHVSHLPLWFHQASCAGMFAVEFLSPLLLLGPRRARLLGAALVAALQSGILLTGNYGYFNFLALALCLAALDDAVPGLARFTRDRAGGRGSAASTRSKGAAAVLAFGVVWAAVSLVAMTPMLGLRPPELALRAAALTAPLRSINRYGLFAAMTKTRDEIVIEVSADGRQWSERAFRWKPSDPRRAPPLLGTHMPRLDWQMWFAALGAPQDSPWFGNLLFRLLSGAPDVEALLAPAPFPGKPQYARAALYSYRFSTPAERKADGSWWQRERKGLFFPVVSLKNQRIVNNEESGHGPSRPSISNIP